MGHPAQLSVSGDAECLSPMLVHELHRIVREALPNSLRHASAPGVSISIVIEAGSVSVMMRNACTRPVVTRARSSRGLEGVRERVELLGGRVKWGMDDDEWMLEALLPIDERASE